MVANDEQGSASTGHTTGPDGSIERARLREGSLLWLRTGRGAWHAEAIGADERNEGRGDTEFRSVLFWVNLARKDNAFSSLDLRLSRPIRVGKRGALEPVVDVFNLFNSPNFKRPEVTSAIEILRGPGRKDDPALFSDRGAVTPIDM